MQKWFSSLQEKSVSFEMDPKQSTLKNIWADGVVQSSGGWRGPHQLSNREECSILFKEVGSPMPSSQYLESL